MDVETLNPVEEKRKYLFGQVNSKRASYNNHLPDGEGPINGSCKGSSSLRREAQEYADRLLCGCKTGIIPDDKRTPFERATDGRLGAFPGTECVSVYAWGAVDEGELLFALMADPATKKILLWPKATHIGTGIAGGKFSAVAVVTLGFAPGGAVPDPIGDQLDSGKEYEPVWTGVQSWSLEGRKVEAHVRK